MTNHVIVDTNVPVVANRKTAQASPTCVASCIRTIQEVRSHRILVIDDAWRILREYIANLRSTGQPGVGDAFLKWVLTNRDNPLHCTQIPLTPAPAPAEDTDFAEFPDDERLAAFDRSDRKFAALAREHAAHPPIYNAVSPIPLYQQSPHGGKGCQKSLSLDGRGI
jgi:hypothetical protein